MGLLRKRQPEQRIAAMPIITDEEAAAILIRAKQDFYRDPTVRSLVDLFNSGLLFGDALAKEAFYDQVQIDLGDELILSCDCCNSVYQYFQSAKSLYLFEGPGC